MQEEGQKNDGKFSDRQYTRKHWIGKRTNRLDQGTEKNRAVTRAKFMGWQFSFRRSHHIYF
jgi:hypothetical protein